MSIPAAVVGAAVVARPFGTFRIASAVVSHTCTAVGALTITGIGFGLAPYVVRRAPLESEQRQALFKDFSQLVGPAPEEDAAQSFPSRVRFHDLQRPMVFTAFTQAARAVFALYADATGTMTQTEFRCALHKMVDITLSWYGTKIGLSPEAQAAAVRKVMERVSSAAFRVIDTNQSGCITTEEFTSAVLLVLAVANGKVVDAEGSHMLTRLTFKLVDEDCDGFVKQAELIRWVELAMTHKTLPPGAHLEDRGPWGIFNLIWGKRELTSTTLAKKWLRLADADKDGRLNQSEFEALSSKLRVHEIVRKMAVEVAL